MRAYLLGYNHGTNDGYHSTLIERGGCEKSYDESLDVEYVAVDEVLEIIEDWKMEGVETKIMNGDAYEHHVETLKKMVLALKGGEQG